MPSTAERLATAAYPLLLLAGVVVLVILMGIESRRERRAAARAAERKARPHSAHVGTATQDVAAILHTHLDEEQRTAAAYDDADLCTAEFPGDDLHAGQLCDQTIGHEGEHKALAEVGPGWRRHITWPNDQQETTS